MTVIDRIQHLGIMTRWRTRSLASWSAERAWSLGRIEDTLAWRLWSCG